MSGIADELTQLGVGLALIGSGTPDQAKDFARAFGVTAPLYVDPRREAYQAFDLAHGVGATLNLESITHGLRAFAGGFRQGAVQGDPWQQGGVFLVMPDGSMPYAYRSRSAGDHPDTEAILAGVRRAIGQ